MNPNTLIVVTERSMWLNPRWPRAPRRHVKLPQVFVGPRSLSGLSSTSSLGKTGASSIAREDNTYANLPSLLPKFNRNQSDLALQHAVT